MVPRAKVVFHLFKKPLFLGSIENAIAFNTSSVLRLARNLVRKIDPEIYIVPVPGAQ